MDANGYPEEVELERIRSWAWEDLPGLMEFVRERWMYADCGYFTEEAGVWELSTGGWSGNEEIMSALLANPLVHLFYWYSSRRGGHYVFKSRNLTAQGRELEATSPTRPGGSGSAR